MFKSIANEPEEIQELFIRIIKLHFNWNPEPMTQNAKANNVENWMKKLLEGTEESVMED